MSPEGKLALARWASTPPEPGSPTGSTPGSGAEETTAQGGRGESLVTGVWREGLSRGCVVCV